MRRLLALAALSIATAIVLAPATAGANTVTATINCERWSFHFVDFPSGQDVPLSVSVTLPQGEGALVSETVHTGGQSAGDVHGDYEIPANVDRTVHLTIAWHLDGTDHVATASSPTKCAPPETTTTSTSTSTTTSSTSTSTTTSTTVPASTTTSSTTTPVVTVPPGETPKPHTFPNTGSESKNLAAAGGAAVFAGWVLVLRNRRRTWAA